MFLKKRFALLSLVLAALLLVPQGVLLRSYQPVSASKSFLAPRHFVNSPEGAISLIKAFLVQGLSLCSPEQLIDDFYSKTPETIYIQAIQGALEYLRSEGTEIILTQEPLHSKLYGLLTLIVQTEGESSITFLKRDGSERKSSSGTAPVLMLSFSLPKLISSVWHIFKGVISVSWQITGFLFRMVFVGKVPKPVTGRRKFVKGAVGFVGGIALFGPSFMATSCSKKKETGSVPGTWANLFLDNTKQEYDNGRAVPVQLPDAAAGKNDTTFGLLVRVEKFAGHENEAPKKFHLSAKVNDKSVVLAPYEPLKPIDLNLTDQDKYVDTFAHVENIQQFGVNHPVYPRAFLVFEPSSLGDTFPAEIIKINQEYLAKYGEEKFPSSKFRPLKANDVITFELRALDGTEVNKPKFVTNGNNSTSSEANIIKVLGNPITIAEPISAIKRNGIPEPGQLDQISVIKQDPDGLSIKDRTVRITHNTLIREPEDSFKPTQVIWRMYKDNSGQKGKLVADGTETVVNPSGANTFDVQIPAKEKYPDAGQAAQDIIAGTYIFEVVNAGLGLTPPPADANKNEQSIVLQFDASPIQLKAPIFKDNSNNALVTLVNGTRLIKFQIDPNFQSSDTLKPEIHYIELTFFDIATQRDYTFTTFVSIPTDLSGAPFTGSRDYYVEIPEGVISPANIVGSYIKSLEVFNVRRGYPSISSGVENVNLAFTSSEKITSTPNGISAALVSAQSAAVNITINPNGAVGDKTTGHHLELQLVHPYNVGTNTGGDALTVAVDVSLPTDLGTGLPEVGLSHTFPVNFNTIPEAKVFLQSGAAQLVSVTALNTSDQVPSGPSVTVDSTTIGANLPLAVPQITASPLTEIPTINSVHSFGDTGVNVNVRVNGNSAAGSSAPNTLLFFFTLENSTGTVFLAAQGRKLSVVHGGDPNAVPPIIADRTKDDLYSITLQDSRIDSGTTIKSVVVVNQDADLNQTSSAAINNPGVTLNPGLVPKAPTNVTVVESGGQSHVAEIMFQYPLQSVDGTALSGSVPDVFIEVVTASGIYYSNFYDASVVQYNNYPDPLIPLGFARVIFDFSVAAAQLPLTVTENATFYVSTAEPGTLSNPADPTSPKNRHAFSARSNSVTKSFLVASGTSAPRRARRGLDSPEVALGFTLVGALTAQKFLEAYQEGLKEARTDESDYQEKIIKEAMEKASLPDSIDLNGARGLLIQLDADIEGSSNYIPQFSAPALALDSAV